MKKLLDRIVFDFRFSRVLGVGLVGKLTLFLNLILLSLRANGRAADGIINTLHLKKFGREFEFNIGSKLDLAILYEIFVEDEYALNMEHAPDIIIDLGSNVGASLVYFALKYPSSKIYGYEPDPNAFKVLKSNVKALPNIKIEQAAVTNHSGEVEFFPDGKSSMSSSLINRRGNKEGIKVKAITLDEIFDNHNIAEVDLLKFDVEGAECSVFSDFKRKESIKNIIGELHLDLIDISKEEFYSLLPKLEFHEEPLDFPGFPKGSRYVISGGVNIRA